MVNLDSTPPAVRQSKGNGLGSRLVDGWIATVNKSKKLYLEGDQVGIVERRVQNANDKKGQSVDC